MLCISAVYLFSFVSFGKYYFTEYKEDTFPLPLFWGTYAEVLDEWEDVIGERTVYTECPYAYYALGEKLSPLEFKLVEKGTKGRDGMRGVWRRPGLPGRSQGGIRCFTKSRGRRFAWRVHAARP